MPECKSIICEVAPDTAIYSLSTNLSFNGTPISVVVPCPPGFICDPPITVTYPPGTFVVPDPPLPPGNDPCTPRPPFRVQGCLSEIIVAIPPCSTAAQIAALAQTVIQQMALQQAQCDTYPPTNPPPPIVVTNQAVAVGCENPRLQLAVTSLPSIPGITFSGGLLRAAAGIFGGTTVAIADASATAFLVGLRETLIDAGNAFCFCIANFVATPGGFSIALTWTAHPLAIRYNILRGTVSGGPYDELGSVTSNFYTDEFLEGDTQYYYVIEPMIEGAVLCQSAEVPGMIVCLGASQPVATINANDITVTWAAHVDAVTYKVERALTAGGPYTTLANDADLFYTDTTAVQGVTYYYLITPIALFNVPICRSKEVSGMRPCLYNLAAAGGATSITVSWTAHPDATNYIVERTTISGGFYTTLINTALTSYEDTAVVADTIYYYRVTPKMGAGNLCISPEVSAELGGVFAWNLVWGAPVLNPGGAGGALDNFTGLPSSSDISVSNNAGGDMSVLVTGAQNYTSATPVNVRATLNGSITSTNVGSVCQWNTVIDSVLHSTVQLSGGDPPWVNVLEDVTFPSGTHLLEIQVACTSDTDGGAHTSTFTAVLTVLP